MILQTRLLGKTYKFNTVKEVLAKASELKSADTLAGIAAETKMERIAAKEVLSELTVHDLRENPVAPYEKDAVTRLIDDELDKEVYKEIEQKTIGEMREWILDSDTDGEAIVRAGKGMTSEVIAAI